MARPLVFPEVFIARVRDDDLDRLNYIVKSFGLSKSEIFRLAVKVVFQCVKNSHSKVEKKASKARLSGSVPLLGELFSADSVEVERELNKALYDEVIKRKKK